MRCLSTTNPPPPSSLELFLSWAIARKSDNSQHFSSLSCDFALSEIVAVFDAITWIRRRVREEERRRENVFLLSPSWRLTAFLPSILVSDSSPISPTTFQPTAPTFQYHTAPFPWFIYLSSDNWVNFRADLSIFAAFRVLHDLVSSAKFNSVGFFRIAILKMGTEAKAYLQEHYIPQLFEVNYHSLFLQFFDQFHSTRIEYSNACS